MHLRLNIDCLNHLKYHKYETYLTHQLQELGCSDFG